MNRHFLSTFNFISKNCIFQDEVILSRSEGEIFLVLNNFYFCKNFTKRVGILKRCKKNLHYTYAIYAPISHYVERINLVKRERQLRNCKRII